MRSQRDERAQAAAAIRPEIQIALHSVTLAPKLERGQHFITWQPVSPTAGDELAALLGDGWGIQSTVLVPKDDPFGNPSLLYTLIRAVAPEALGKEPIPCR